jgi:hypothetical protein
MNLRNNGNEDQPFIKDPLKTRKVHTIHYSYDSNKNVNTPSPDEQPHGDASSPSLRQDVCHRAVSLTSILQQQWRLCCTYTGTR